MRALIIVLVVVVAGMRPDTASAQTAVPMEIGGQLKQLPDTGDALDLKTATLRHRDAAQLVIGRTLKSAYPDLDINADDFYCIIHVFKWGAVAEDGSQSVDKQNWYVYRGTRDWSDRQFAGTRIVGSRQVWLLYIHLNRKGTNTGYTPSYQVTVTPKQATNVQALMQLAKLFPGASGLPLDAAGKLLADSIEDGWGGEKITLIEDLPCDVSVTPRIMKEVEAAATLKVDGAGDTLLPVTHKPAQVVTTPLDNPKIFDNEGKSWWDVSVGIPINGVNDLKFEEGSTEATVKTIDQTAVVALLSIYVPAVDLKSKRAYFVPRPVIGVGISAHPLDKVLLGGAIGTPLFNFFAAGAYTRVLAEDGTRSDKREWQFVSGISIPVVAWTKLLKAKEKDQ